MSIEIKQLKKSFGTKEVLKGIDMFFEQGKINMIIGASGSGKSVMLKCIVGLMRPDEGHVLYDGMDFHRANHKEVRNFRKNMGMLFQYSALFDSMTVEENIAFPLKLFTKYTKKAIKKRVEFCMDRVTMAGTNDLLPAELSGGMKKRVGIARAIALNPKYLFVDEPNSGLDPLTAAVIDELIQEITYEYNMCTVVVSHDMNSVVNISDNIMFLYHGHKEWEGTKRSILRSGNENVDKFVFVSDLIRRDLYDEEWDNPPKENSKEKKQPHTSEQEPVAEKSQTASKNPPQTQPNTEVQDSNPSKNSLDEDANAQETSSNEPEKEAPVPPKGKKDLTDRLKKSNPEANPTKEQEKKSPAVKSPPAADSSEDKPAENSSEEQGSEGGKASPKQSGNLRSKNPRTKVDPRLRGTRRDPRRRPPKK